MKDFDHMGFIKYCKTNKILGAIDYDGIIVETDEENPKAVAYIPGVISGICPAPGYRVRIASSVNYWNVRDAAELMAPEHLHKFESSCPEDSSSTS